MINKFEKLDVWKKAVSLATFVYSVTDNYPKSEIFALTSQTNRAVVSIAANIAEGSSRNSKKDFGHFLDISIGSAFELITLLKIACAQKYLSATEFEQLQTTIEIIVRLTYGLKRSLNGQP